MATVREQLEAKVEAVNLAHDVGNKLYKELMLVFSPLVGQKILKADGTLLAKYAALVPPMPSNFMLHIYKLASEYSLAWVIRASVNNPNGAQASHECTVYIGNIYKHSVLNGLYDGVNGSMFEGRSDYTADEILCKRQKFAEAQKAFEDAKRALFPFHERYDT